MKTLLIDISDAPFSINDDEVLVVKSALGYPIEDFYYALGDEIAAGVNINIDKTKLIKRYIDEHPDESQSLIEQARRLKAIVYGDNPDGIKNIEIVMPDSFFKWISLNGDDSHLELYMAKFQNEKNAKFTIDVELFYHDYVRPLVRNAKKQLKQYPDIEELVVNELFVSRRSDIVRAILEGNDEVGFVPWEKFRNGIKPELPKASQTSTKKQPDVYDKIEEFSEGLAAVERNGLWGFIDTNFQEIIPCEYKEVGSFYHGVCPVSDDWKSYSLIDDTGKIFFQGLDSIFFNGDDYYSEVDGFYVTKEEKAGIVNRMGRVVIPFEWDMIMPFYRGKAFSVRNNQLFIINRDGEILKRIGVFDDINFSDNVWYVSVKKDGYWGVVNRLGELKIDFLYDNIYTLSSDLFEVEKDDMHGIIDEEGNEIVDCQYKSIINFLYGAVLCDFGKTRRIFDYEARKLLKGEYNPIAVWDYNEDDEEKKYYPMVSSDGFGVLVGRSGRVALSTEYRKIWPPHEGLIKVFDYEDSTEWETDDDGFEGMIDTEGEVVVPVIYDELSRPYSGLIVAKYKGEYCIINSKNELVFPNKVRKQDWEIDNQRLNNEFPAFNGGNIGEYYEKVKQK